MCPPPWPSAGNPIPRFDGPEPPPEPPPLTPPAKPHSRRFVGPNFPRWPVFVPARPSGGPPWTRGGKKKMRNTEFRRPAPFKRTGPRPQRSPGPKGGSSQDKAGTPPSPPRNADEVKIMHNHTIERRPMLNPGRPPASPLPPGCFPGPWDGRSQSPPPPRTKHYDGIRLSRKTAPPARLGEKQYSPIEGPAGIRQPGPCRNRPPFPPAADDHETRPPYRVKGGDGALAECRSPPSLRRCALQTPQVFETPTFAGVRPPGGGSPVGRGPRFLP